MGYNMEIRPEGREGRPVAGSNPDDTLSGCGSQRLSRCLESGLQRQALLSPLWSPHRRSRIGEHDQSGAIMVYDAGVSVTRKGDLASIRRPCGVPLIRSLHQLPLVGTVGVADVNTVFARGFVGEHSAIWRPPSVSFAVDPIDADPAASIGVGEMDLRRTTSIVEQPRAVWRPPDVLKELGATDVNRYDVRPVRVHHVQAVRVVPITGEREARAVG